MILGGGALSAYSNSQALGINPSAANGTVVLDTTGNAQQNFNISVGDYVVYSFGALASFYGVVTETSDSFNDPSQGRVQNFTVVDNRVRLQWQEVFMAINMEDEMVSKRLGRPAAPAAPGDAGAFGADAVTIGGEASPIGNAAASGAIPEAGDAGLVRRRYWSILPQHWAAGIKTWHDQPFTARQVLNFAFAGAWGDFGFDRSYHPALSDTVIFGLDHTGGIKLANLISAINEKAGLEMAIVGARELKWFRKGEGLLPLPDNRSSGRSTGESLSSVDTAVMVVGERVRVQVANVELEPDWKPVWEAFIDELAWRREVAEVFALPTATKEDQANLSAKAREVTVYQYAKQKNDPDYLDYRLFGQVSRVNMSAWLYIQELVFRSYRIPPGSTLYGIPLSSLEMADSLLVGTDINGTGDAAKQDYVSNPVEFYPSAQAQVMHKGQPLDFLQARDIRLFYTNAKSLRDEWTMASDFEVDSVNMSIRFSSPVFIDGTPEEGTSLYLKVNKGEGGGADLSVTLDPESDYLDVIVPNPDVKLQPAGVRASFCFLMGRYHRAYGKGPRRGTLSVGGLGLHLVDTKGTGSFVADGVGDFSASDLPFPTTTGSSFREILYEDGKGAKDKADAAAASMLGLSPVLATGGFKRHGVVGAEVSGVVDRVSITIGTSGVIEDVSYTKGKVTGVPLAERTLQRIQRTTELYPGQEELKKEVRQYRLIAAAEKTARKPERSGTHNRFADVFSKPVGSDVQNSIILHDKNGAAPVRGGVAKWLAGDLVWLDGSGYPSATGKAFGGVVVFTPVMQGPEGDQVQSKEIMVANKGIVPVRVSGVVPAGATVFADKGAHAVSASGEVAIGMLMHGEDVPEPPAPEGNAPATEVLAMVSLGFGGGAGTGPCYFGEIISYQDGEGSAAESKVGIRAGLVEYGGRKERIDHYEVNLGVDSVKLVWLRVAVVANTNEDGSVTLSALKNEQAGIPVWETGDISAGYPFTTHPAIFPSTAPGAGEIILPVGKLSVVNGTATLDRTGCGHFVVTHCPGFLDYYRRGDSGSSSSGNAPA